MTTYTTTEGTGLVELCAVITSPQNGVVAPRPFVISVTTTDDSAGRATALIISLYVYIEYWSDVILPHSVAPGDYVSLNGLELAFNVGDERVCHNVMINDDDLCEQPAESFLTRLSYVSGKMPITIDPEEAQTFINDDNQPECSE